MAPQAPLSLVAKNRLPLALLVTGLVCIPLLRSEPFAMPGYQLSLLLLLGLLLIGHAYRWQLTRQQRHTLLCELAELGPDGFLLIDPEGHPLHVSAGLTRLTGLSAVQLRHDLGLIETLMPPAQVAPWRERLRGTCETPLWLELRDTHGEMHWLEVTTQRARTPDGDEGLRVSFNDRSEVHTLALQLEQMTYFDPLTQLPNRTRMEQLLEERIADGRPFYLLCIGVPRFTEINEVHGHTIGDSVILRMVQLMNDGNIRGVLGRFGGADFLLLLDGALDPEAEARRLLEQFQQPIPIGRLQFHLELCIGQAEYPRHANSADTLLRNANAAMLEVRRRDGEGYGVFEQHLHAQRSERLQIEGLLHRALERDEFRLHYQPKVECLSGRPVGVEALLRWRSPLGEISPARFIPAAEESGQILAIGEWLIERVCRDYGLWQDRGQQVCIALNASARELALPDYAQRFERVLQRHQVPYDQVQLEITESLFITDLAQGVRTLSRLREMGIRIAIDDFGTGYSSLSRLCDLPVDYLKIDQRFIHGLLSRGSDYAMVKSIIALGHNVGLQVIAEGIEHPTQHQALKRLGCDFCQGFYFSRPLDPPQLMDYWLREHLLTRVG